MKPSFDRQIDRQGTWAEKYDARETLFGRADVIPMWVADMDLATPDFVLAAIQSRLNHPILGYTQVPLSVAQSVSDWQQRQHQWAPAAESVVWLSGVVSGIYLSIQAVTQPGDAVMVFTPVYPPFMRSVTHLERRLVEVPLAVSQDQTLRYELDWQAIETAMRTQQIKLLLLSNPHNPSGRVWSRVSLLRLAELCLRYQVTVVADEVWSDLLLDTQSKHQPFAYLSSEISAQTITLNAPSKTFNLAAMHTAYAIIENEQLRRQFLHIQQRTRAGEAGLLGLHALQAAYSDAGAAWLASLLVYLRDNVAQATKALASCLPELVIMCPQASYLLWLDASAYFSEQQHQVDWWVNQAGLGLSNGTHFGAIAQGFMRMNVGCCQQQLQQALLQVQQVSSQLTKQENSHVFD